MSKVLFDHIAIAIPRMADAPAVLAGLPRIVVFFAPRVRGATL